MRSRALRLLSGFALSGLFLYLALRDVAWDQVGEALAGTDWRYATLSALAGLVGVGLRGVRWGAMLRPIQHVPLATLTLATFIGSLANNVLPARGGDLARAFVLARRVDFPLMEALAAVVYARVLDVFAALAILALAMLQPVVPVWTRGVGLTLLLANSSLLVILWLAARHPSHAQRALAWVGRALPRWIGSKVEVRAAALVRGFAASMSRDAFAPVVLSSVALLVVSVGAVYLCLPAVAIEPEVGHAVLTTALVSVASMIPAAPGNLGTIQFACVVGLTAHGVPRGTALSYAFLYHATQYLPPTVVGALALWSTGRR